MIICLLVRVLNVKMHSSLLGDQQYDKLEFVSASPFKHLFWR